MASEHSTELEDKALCSLHSVELVAALVFVGLGILLAIDNARTGIGWSAAGPEAGLFPFVLSVMMVIAGGCAFLSAWRTGNHGPFSTVQEGKRLTTILVPSILFVTAIGWLGIYVSGFLMILGFMTLVGRFRFLTALAVALPVILAMFWLFEIQFQVFLPSGPLEAWLGY